MSSAVLRHFRLQHYECWRRKKGCAGLKDSEPGDVTHMTSYVGGLGLVVRKVLTARYALQPSVAMAAQFPMGKDDYCQGD